MTDGQHDGHLGAVYAAKAPHEVAAVYDAWAQSYDLEMARAGYRHPSVGLALLSRHAPRGAGPVLDAGCGTGLLGDWLFRLLLCRHHRILVYLKMIMGITRVYFYGKPPLYA